MISARFDIIILQHRAWEEPSMLYTHMPVWEMERVSILEGGRGETEKDSANPLKLGEENSQMRRWEQESVQK